MSAKPPYVPKPGTQPHVASAPHQTINAPFRISRKILSKEVLPGGSITYHLGAFLPSESPLDNAAPDFIHVSATDIDDHVSYEELERFEHEDFESEVARENDENERRQIKELLQGSFTRGRGRPKKRKGLDSNLVYGGGGALSHANSDDDGESGGTESETSSSEVEGIANDHPLAPVELLLIGGAGKASSSPSRAAALTNTEGKPNLNVRIEIPIRSNQKGAAIPPSILERNKSKVETSIVLDRLKPTSSPKGRPSMGNATSSVIGLSETISGSSRDGRKVTIKSNDDSLFHESDNHKHVPLASLTSQRRTSIESVHAPAPTKTMSAASSGEGQPQQKATYQGRHTPVDEPRAASVYAQNRSAPKTFDAIVISDDEDGEGLYQSPQIPQLKPSIYHETVRVSGKVILASTADKAIKKDGFKLSGHTDFNDEDDILTTRPTPITTNSNHHVAQPLAQHNTPRRHQSLKKSNPAASSPSSHVRVSNQPLAPPALPLSRSSKQLKSSRAFIADTDSEDDLAAGEQLLQELKEKKTKVPETAESLLRRFQTPPLKHLHASSSAPKPLVHKESSKPSAIPKALMKSASTPRKPSMTSPFPSGKPIRRNIPPRTKEIPQTGASKALVPAGESDNDLLTKKRKRDTFFGPRRTARPSDDPEAEWSPSGKAQQTRRLP